VRDFLHELAVAASEDLPGLSCGILVARRRRIVPLAESDVRARELDLAGVDGPHSQAAERRELVDMPDIATDPRWPAFRVVAERVGVRAAMVLPIELDHDDVGTALLSLYADDPNAFDDSDTRNRLRRLRGEATRALSLATRLQASERTAEQLEDALSSRAVIDRAIGIVMHDRQCAADAAFDALRRVSQNRNTKLREVANSVVAAVSSGQSADSVLSA
jgi:hypothetical protein